MAERLINRRQQGDLGEASAIEWLTRQGATVFTPLGHSPAIDLVADFGERVLRIQVKTTTHRRRGVYTAMLATNGGNQSWTRQTKHFDRGRCDALFVLVGDGRRWFIPAGEVDGTRGINLGGAKYAEYEIEPGAPLAALVYGRDTTALESDHTRGSFGAGEPSDSVKVVPTAEWVRIPPPPSSRSMRRVGRGPAGTTSIGPTRKVTLPAATLERVGLAIGDRLHVGALTDGTLILTRIVLPDPVEEQRDT